MLEIDRPQVFREVIRCRRKRGTSSIPGVYVGYDDEIPLVAIMNKALTIKSGQTHVQRYMEPLLQKIVDGEIDPTFVITHRASLDDGPQMYKTFRDKADGCLKVVMRPGQVAGVIPEEPAA